MLIIYLNYLFNFTAIFTLSYLHSIIAKIYLIDAKKKIQIIDKTNRRTAQIKALQINLLRGINGTRYNGLNGKENRKNNGKNLGKNLQS